MLRGLGQFAELRGSLAKKREGVFEGVVLQCTLWFCIKLGFSYTWWEALDERHLCWETFLYYKLALRCNEGFYFFFWRKNEVSFSRYLDFWVFVESTNFCHDGHNCIWEVNIFHCFFWTLGSVKMKSAQILMQIIRDVSNLLWGQFWKLETIVHTQSSVADFRIDGNSIQKCLLLKRNTIRTQSKIVWH